ncbi:LPS O-antigen chain length determinant protein WzzB [Pantoea sp. BS_8]|uniref:LPS O-antigen chain length determinant protein WzzB n=1 Tax=unclassified Pantoea TaxID=2630326 RepID=UPI000D75C71E|nr:LPS O-antigen chain length determinant protein WzzB [Pantoea sp. PNA 03-3]PXV75705.1 chain length determinant protein (polysaccharide antigen chain regulator) [Pantoea sp. PNA 03-3]
MNEKFSTRGEQPNVPKNSVSSKDELDLMDVFFQLWQGKKFIILGMVIALIIAAIYVSVVKEKWTSQATVTLPAAGQVANYNAALAIVYADTPQDKPSLSGLQNQLFGRFSASLSALSGALANLEEPLTLRIDSIKGRDDALNVSFVGHTAKEAQSQLSKYIDKINADVVKDYGDDIKRNLSVKTRELTNTLDTYTQVAINQKEHRLDVIKQALKVAQASNVDKLQVKQADFLSDDTLYLLGTDALNAMVANENSKPLDYGKEYYEAQRALLAVTHLKIEVENLQSYRYISEADLPFRRDSPKKALILFLSLIGGAILGGLFVLTRNALISYKNN